MIYYSELCANAVIDSGSRFQSVVELEYKKQIRWEEMSRVNGLRWGGVSARERKVECRRSGRSAALERGWGRNHIILRSKSSLPIHGTYSYVVHR